MENAQGMHTPESAERIVERLREMHGTEHECADGWWAPPDLTDQRHDP